MQLRSVDRFNVVKFTGVPWRQQQEKLLTDVTHMYLFFCTQSQCSNTASAVQVGFSEQNIRALCDVGKSTKQHKVGYIGQKGIGFKSVFKVTDVAEIHSSGFHISFDLIQHQSLGYILPTWVPARPHAHPRVRSLQSAVTQVYLPYKQVSLQQALLLL